MNRIEIVKKALNVNTKEAIKIIDHLTKYNLLYWIDDYDENYHNDDYEQLLVDVHCEDNFEDMIDFLYEDYSPSEMIKMSADIKDHEEMLDLGSRIILWWGFIEEYRPVQEC